MIRISLKITGAQGQGVNSVGELCAKGLKRAGYCVFGYREYMSLIKGGHSSYQLDISHEYLESTERTVNVLVCFNHHGLERNWQEVKEGGIILHQTPQWTFPKEDDAVLRKRDIHVIYLPTEDILKKLKGKAILGNVLITAAVWALFGRGKENLQELVREQFGHKGEQLLKQNFACIDEGFSFVHAMGGATEAASHVVLPEPDVRWKDQMLITGSQAMGLGLIHAGCRVYSGYPMTPSSPLLTFIADMQNRSGMVVKQAEDEITAAQMMLGAMHMGTRAATGTSGGGFDLMTESVSLCAMIECPGVFILAQRPGPATGLPTWTGQGDLLLAVGSAHGEFARCVLSVSNAEDAFALMHEAFNLAETYQTPVIVMTDKQTAEALYTQSPFDQSKTVLDRGALVTDPAALSMLKSTDRYDPSVKNGISHRWLPGSHAATYCAQGDEHSGDGSVCESSDNAVAQMEKRMRKMEVLKDKMPEPDVWVLQKGAWKKVEGTPILDLLIVSFGSNKGVILDAAKQITTNATIGYLHYAYIWPMKTARLIALQKKAKRTVLIECNYQSQLGMLIRLADGPSLQENILQYDGRPFFVDALAEKIAALLPAHSREPL